VVARFKQLGAVGFNTAEVGSVRVLFKVGGIRYSYSAEGR